MSFAFRRARGLAVLVLLGSIAWSSPLAAQNLLDQSSANELRKQFLADLDTVHVKVMALAEVIPAEKYTWSPTPETRTIANALMHVASEWYIYVPAVIGGSRPADMAAPRESIPMLEKITDKSVVLDHLRKAWDHARHQVESADLTPLLGQRQLFGNPTTLPQVLFLMSGDLHEHLGQLVVYTRSVGLVPPWSK